MTREQKLALVLGFAAVLIVGLLISDHMAAARSAALDEAPHDATVVVDASEGQALKRVVTLPTPTAEIQAQGPAQGPTQNQELYRGRPVQRQAADESVAARAQLKNPAVAQASESDPAPIVFRVGEDGGVQNPAGSETMIGRFGRSVANGLNSMGEQIRDFTGSAGDNAPVALGVIERDARQSDQARSRTVSVAPVVVQHHVQPNESLYKIAERYFGDGNRWRKIAQDNEGRVGENGSVRQGVTLRIIDPTRGVEVARAATPDRLRDSAEPGASRTVAQQPRGPLTYTVQPNDTLSEISQKLLGTMRRQHELIALNRDVLKDPDQLRAGMVLKLPSS